MTKKLIDYFKQNRTVLSLVYNKKHKTLQIQTQTLSFDEIREVKLIMDLLDKIYELYNSENFKFRYFNDIPEAGTRTIFRDIVEGLEPIYDALIDQTNDLEQFRAFFELLVGITEEVFTYIQNMTDDNLDCFGGHTRTPYSQEVYYELYVNTVECLKGNPFTYDKILDIIVKVSFQGIASLTFDVIDFYDLKL
jgi:hypothetical protein